MPQRDDDLLRKTYELAKANNKMIRKMRRAALWGLIFKIVLYGVLLGIPVWLYFQFVAPTINEFATVAAQVQSTGASAQGQMQGIIDLLNSIPGVDFSGTQ